MQKADLARRLAVCSWSLRPSSPDDLVASLGAAGLSRVQLALDPLREDAAKWGACGDLLRARGVAVVSGMFGTIGEDYSTLETIKRTGGVVPDSTWEANWRAIQQVVPIARALGVSLVTFHAGFLPHDEADPGFARLLERMRRIADLFAAGGLELGLETGQETADTLAAFLRVLARPNVGVNFDPANMILYGKGDPIAALRTLSPWLKQCHVKDARATKVPGTWGDEVAVGSGEVDWPAFLATLDAVGYRGDLCIEREAGEQRVADIVTARLHLARLAA